MCLAGEEELDEFRTVAESETVDEVETVVSTPEIPDNSSAILTGSNSSENPHSWDDLLNQYDWDVNLARAIMLAESEGNPNAFNPEWHRGCQGSIGLMQVACLHTENQAELFDPAVNVQKAYEIWRKQGWTPWGVFTNGSYLQYLE